MEVIFQLLLKLWGNNGLKLEKNLNIFKKRKIQWLM